MRTSILSLLVLLVAVVGVSASDRTLDVSINPDCSPSPEACSLNGTQPPFVNNLVYVVSQNVTKNTTDAKDYRLFWSTIGAPTVLFTEVPPNTDKNINLTWSRYLNETTSKAPFLYLWGGRYVGITLVKLIEFNDTKNTGRMVDPVDGVNATEYDLSKTQWWNVSMITYPDGSVLGNFSGKIEGAGNITIEVKAHTLDGRADMPPRLQFDTSSVSIRVVLNNLLVHYMNPRFAVEFIFSSNDSSKTEATHSKDTSISDEYSPGIFTVEKVSGRDTYMQWRPVVYTSQTSPGVSDSTRSFTEDLTAINATETHGTDIGVPYSLLQGLNGIWDNGNTLVRFTVIFGITDDGFYNGTKFQEWTCQIGIGQPPLDAVSGKIKLIIAIGFGLPAALIAFGSGYVVYLKIKRRRAASASVFTADVPNYSTLDE